MVLYVRWEGVFLMVVKHKFFHLRSVTSDGFYTPYNADLLNTPDYTDQCSKLLSLNLYNIFLYRKLNSMISALINPGFAVIASCGLIIFSMLNTIFVITFLGYIDTQTQNLREKTELGITTLPPPNNTICHLCVNYRGFCADQQQCSTTPAKTKKI
jgi:hypothetical protein